MFDLYQEIRHRILSSGFYVIQSSVLHLTQLQAETFYSEHEGRFFHQRLVTFMKRLGSLQCLYFLKILPVLL